MELKIAVYNMEWMRRLFFSDGSPKKADEGSQEDRKHGERSAMLAEVVRTIDPDILCIVEGPDTLANQTKTASEQLEAWRDLHQLDANYVATHGFPSSGQQELCALFKKNKVTVVHDPEKRQSKNPFNESFLVDTTESLIKEFYKHFRPPLELSIRDGGQNDQERALLIVAHAKSKGIFDAVDFARFEQLSERNRKELFAECFSIRERCDQWFKENSDAKIIVTGDINDGL